MNGRTILDFSNGQYRLSIKVSSPKPVAQQLVEQVQEIMNDPSGYTAPLSATAVDASANQGLADDLDIFIGQGRTGCMHVNNSTRASSNPIRFRAGSDVGTDDLRRRETCKDRYQDRGTEAWCVLAEFVKAGMVRGLPEEALRAITQRRFMLDVKKSNGVEVASGTKFPLQLEKKADFKARFKKSPDECDACALAALAVKEVLGVLPFGWFKGASAPLVGPTVSRPVGLPKVSVPMAGAYRAESDGRSTFNPESSGGSPW